MTCPLVDGDTRGEQNLALVHGVLRGNPEAPLSGDRTAIRENDHSRLSALPGDKTDKAEYSFSAKLTKWRRHQTNWPSRYPKDGFSQPQGGRQRLENRPIR